MKNKKKRVVGILIMLTSVSVLVPIVGIAEEENNMNEIVNKVNEIDIEQGLWQSDFPGGEIGQWEDVIGKTNRELINNQLEFSRNPREGNNAITLNLDSPELADGEVETMFKYSSGKGRTGVVIRGNSKDNWLFVGYNDNGKWLIESPNSWDDSIPGPIIDEGTSYLLKVRYVGEKITNL